MATTPIETGATVCPTIDYEKIKEAYVPDRKDIIIDGIIANLASFMILILVVWMLRSNQL